MARQSSRENDSRADRRGPEAGEGMETEKEVRMKRLFAATLLLLLLEGSSQIISAQTYKAKTLRGLRGVYVLIEGLSSDAKKAGLTKSQLQIDVEVELRKAGILVLTEDERVKTPGRPYLYVNVTSVALPGEFKGLYAYHVTVQLNQMADLRRNRSIGIYGITWERAYVGYSGKSHLKRAVREGVKDYVNAFINETVRDYVNAFINDYLTVNPK